MRITDDIRQTLSAYLDGELEPDVAHEVEALVASDPDVEAELMALTQTDALVKDAFDGMLSDPVPLSIAREISGSTQSRRWPMTAMAASVAALVVGIGIGTYGGLAPVPSAPGWLDHVADYHRVYAAETRHLVEVGADEADHIQTWIGNRTGVNFNIPDLTEFGLTFEGGRLLVANGKPVAQLMYRDAAGTVFALCFQSSGQGATDGFTDGSRKGIVMQVWRTDTAAFVLVGPDGSPLLSSIAKDAALQV
jgi:anti-sigma factor RsiW